MTGRLIDHDELAVWHKQKGAGGGWFDADATWAIADETGAPLGTVSVDGGLLEQPDYWIHDAAGAPVLGVTHADGVLARVNSPWHRIVWGDGNPVGYFRDSVVYWQDQPVGKWRVDAPWSGYTATFGGAWLWDPADTPVASVTLEQSAGGSYFALRRQGTPDEALQWSAVALVLVARELHRRSEAQAAHARNRRYNRRHNW
jgi:hypothetical protein